MLERVTSLPFCTGHPDLDRRQAAGAELLFDWLSEQPGGSWQERWLGVEPSILGQAWAKVRGAWLAARPRRSSWHTDLMAVALRLAISADIVRPSPRWLVSGQAGAAPWCECWRDPGIRRGSSAWPSTARPTPRSPRRRRRGWPPGPQ